MNFLAVDTSNDYLSVVAVKDGKVFNSTMGAQPKVKLLELLP